VFDYGANQGEFGSDLAAEGLVHIRERIETVTGVSLRSGEAHPDELAGDWDPEPAPAVAPQPGGGRARDPGVRIQPGPPCRQPHPPGRRRVFRLGYGHDHAAVLGRKRGDRLF